MQKTIFRTKSTIPCRDDAELASEQTYQTAFTAWQQQPGNEFSFRQPGSTTQAVFLEGMGLQEEEPAVLERRALQRISNQLGILFLHQLLAPYLVLIVCVIVFSLLGGSLSYSVHDNVLYGSNNHDFAKNCAVWSSDFYGKAAFEDAKGRDLLPTKDNPFCVGSDVGYYDVCLFRIWHDSQFFAGI